MAWDGRRDARGARCDRAAAGRAGTARAARRPPIARSEVHDTQAAQAIGIARAALEFARDYATGRNAFGPPIIENQGVAFPLADLAAEIDAARLLTWRAAWMAAQRKPFENAEGSMSKQRIGTALVI